MAPIYEIVWARVAEKDLIDIIDHVATDSPANALQIFQKIKKKSSSLYTMPERCRIVPELRDQGIMQYRELIVPPWRIMFKITDLKVFVLLIIDSRRNIEDIFSSQMILAGISEVRSMRIKQAQVNKCA